MLKKKSWEVKKVFSEVGCSEIISNMEKIQDMCNPSHYLCNLSVTEKNCSPEKERP